MIEILVQVGLAVFGAASIFLLSSRAGRTRRWGYIAGLVSEPLWLYTAWWADQWGIIFLALWWSVFYARGAINNWRIV